MSAERAQQTNEPFARAASELRAADGRSVRALSKVLGISPGYLSRLLSEQRPASITQMEEIADAFGKPRSFFLEVRVERIAGYLRTHDKRREELWDELPLDHS
jgi:transcriptional regulator with XRE-family HTH domain